MKSLNETLELQYFDWSNQSSRFFPPEMSEVTYNIIYDKVGMIVWLLRKDKRKLKNNINKN